ncbi:hemolysin family protein [Oceanobacillus alkalisoli]|uniref:hemolysin family protein n=1 Tax=Oceanobacillus alkalisoli TaxID=2925113 RepID=UPI001EE48E0D|nr:CNNM domain-containing protein [Oceanobacillus alkalisoli]MCG5103168.1 CNNM domain-containing protein [Oceanobacillus alkalisoli]
MMVTVLITGIIILFIASSYFSGSETALTATNEMKLQLKAASGDKKAERLLKLVNNPDLFIPGILIANNVPNIVLPSLVTIVALEFGWNIGITTAILTVLIIIFAEVMPKSVAAAFPERISYIVYYPTMLILLILKPFIWLLNLLTKTTIRLLGKGEGEEITISKAEMRAMVDIAHTEGTFKNDEMYRLKSMMDFQTLNVSDVLKTHRVEMKAIPTDIAFDEAKEFLLENHHTRYPIYEGDSDNIVGVFHSKFILSWSINPGKGIKEFSDMNPLFIYEFNSIDSVFKKMMDAKKHIAIVLDEYGGTEGLITHEDLIETMIGQDIEDEMDEDDALIHEQTETVIICDGRLSLHRLNTVFQVDLPEEADNVAGFILSQYSYLPEEGEIFSYGNLEFKVLEVSERRVHLVAIRKLQDND